jgi:hypothetical protein
LHFTNKKPNNLDKPIENEVQNSLRANMAVMLKEQGNSFFTSGDFEAALRCYSKAIEHDTTNPHLHLNKVFFLPLLKDIGRRFFEDEKV